QAVTTVVQLLPGRTTIAVAFRLISKTLGAVEGAVLALDTVAGSHIRDDAPIRQPLQKLSVPVGRVSRYRFGLSSLPLRKTGEHVLCGHRLLTHPGGRRLHPHDHATLVVDQIVVVVSQASWRPAFGSVGGIGIGGRHLILLMHRLLYWVLLFQF